MSRARRGRVLVAKLEEAIVTHASSESQSGPAADLSPSRALAAKRGRPT
ncbi:MAG: hypothetical protein HYY06_11325 [Deltaproteobacteria bacterium]|nr:hypothetical protein [Deltaproteobacteria bacterium]